MIKVLVNIAYNHPVGLAPADLPAFIVMVPGGRYKGILRAFELCFDRFRMRLQDGSGLVGGVVVCNEIGVDKWIVVLEEKWQHLFFIPA